MSEMRINMSFDIFCGNKKIKLYDKQYFGYRFFSRPVQDSGISVTENIRYFGNINRIQDFSKLLDNWDGYGADPIPSDVVENAKKVLKQLKYQPEVFPTAAETIQFEYDGPDNSYLEFQVGKDNVFNLFYVDTKGNKKHINNVGGNELNNIIESFYERTL